MAHYKIVLSILILVLHIIQVDNLSLVFTKHRRNTIMDDEGPIREDEQTTTAHNIERDSSTNSSQKYENQRNEPIERAPCKCTDAIQDCNVISNPVTCCMIAPIMNMSCQKSCLFCYDMQSPSVPGGMPGVPLPSVPGQNKPVIYQNPCNPQMPPQIVTECPELQNPFPNTGNNPFPNNGGTNNNNPFPSTGNNNNNNNNNNNQQISQAIHFPQNTNQG